MRFPFPRKAPAPRRGAARIPEGQRIYAVGDIHGRADLLDRVEALVRADLDVRPPPGEVVFVLLGDYIDRGPASREVVERLAAPDLPGRVVALRGNHESMLEAALDGGTMAMDHWLRNGGLETLQSYGVDVADAARGIGYEQAAAAFRGRLPAAHRDFLESLPLTCEAGDYFFCHAGVRPGIPLGQQEEADLLWIREEFLDSPLDHGKVVVHGHTPVDEPELLENRINLDTGAYFTDRLSCLVLEGAERRLLGP